MICNEYEAGDKDGKLMKICRYYMAGGPCSKPNHFMCDYWMVKNHKDMYNATRRVLRKFPGSRIKSVVTAKAGVIG